MKKLKKGNIVTLMAESVNKLLKTDGPFWLDKTWPIRWCQFLLWVVHHRTLTKEENMHDVNPPISISVLVISISEIE